MTAPILRLLGTVSIVWWVALNAGQKITWDPKTERIVGDDEADAFLSRPQREGYEIAGQPLGRWSKFFLETGSSATEWAKTAKRSCSCCHRRVDVPSGRSTPKLDINPIVR